MSPQRHQQRAAWALVAGVVAIGALILSVWLVGARAADSVHDSEARARQALATKEHEARVAQNESLRRACARGVARDFEAWETNRDLRNFSRDAAVARHASGDHAVARGYDGIARRAERRMARIRLRLPVRENEAAVTAFCRDLYPEPTPAGR